MKIVALFVFCGLCSSLKADELILKDGRRIAFRVLKDAGDAVEVQTVDNQHLTFKKDDIKDVKLVTPRAPLTGATFIGDDTKAAEKPVNLLAALDLKKNGVTGQWRTSSGSVVGSGIGLLEIPYIPTTASYDVEVSLERKEGDDEIVIGLIAAGKPFSITFDWGKGDASGLTCIGAARVYENDTRVSGKQLANRKPVTVKCAVRDGHVVVLVDGKTLIDWKGDVKQLSHPGRTKEQNLFFGIRNTTVMITRYIFTARQ